MIYFVKPRGKPYVKIGHARSVRRRLEQLQGASPYELVILSVIAGGPAREKLIHARFAHLRVRGEWFRYSREVRRFLRAESHEYQADVHEPQANGATGQEQWYVPTAVASADRQRPRRRIRVWAQNMTDRPHLMLQWLDPDTGKRRSKTAATANPDEAELRRADLEAALKQNPDT
jgi:hypothetical protein